jgi:membrane protease YdiL (CAAX protease family)
MLAYLALTFAVSWTLWLLPGALGAPRTGLLALGGPVFLLGVFAPGLVALSLTARSSGGAGVRRLLAPIGRWEVAGRYYAFALGVAAGTRVAAAVAVRLWTGGWPTFGPSPVLLLLATLVSTPTQAGEEVGWRGYALPRLASGVGLGPATLVLGVIWATWHLPLFFIAGSGSDGQSFPYYVLWVTAWSVALGWLYWSTGGSLLLPMLMHAALNNTTGIVSAAAPAGPVFGWHTTPLGWLSLAIMWLVAAVLLVHMRRARLPRVGATPGTSPPAR